MKTPENFVTGAKALVGGILAGLIAGVFYAIGAILAKGDWIVFSFVFYAIGFVVYIFALGWILRTIWRWK